MSGTASGSQYGASSALTTSSSFFPQPAQIPSDSKPDTLYKSTPASLSHPEQRARGFYTALAHSPEQTEEERLKVRYLEVYDTLSNAKSIFLATLMWEHLSFAKDWAKYKWNYNKQLLPPETQRLKPSYVVRTIYSAHLGRSLKFFPAVVAALEIPYLLTGDQRWRPSHYIATGSALGFYYGLLTKRTPLYLFSSSFFPAMIGGIYGHLEDLRGRPLWLNTEYLGQRRISDEAANKAIQNSTFSKFFA